MLPRKPLATLAGNQQQSLAMAAPAPAKKPPIPKQGVPAAAPVVRSFPVHPVLATPASNEVEQYRQQQQQRLSGEGISMAEAEMTENMRTPGGPSLTSSTSPSSEALLVAVRLRPLNDKELAISRNEAWQVVNRISIMPVNSESGAGSLYTFDRAYGPEASTGDLYDELVRPVVSSSLAGMNGTVFAYGQTASGKTYTMQGDEDDHPGILRLAARQLLEEASRTTQCTYVFVLSYIELYNETLKDLLSHSTTELKVREDRVAGFYVDGVTELEVSTFDDIVQAFKRGESRRHVAGTDMNEKSSRSHTIFSISITAKERPNDSGEYTFGTLRAKLSLVDLAGSENVRSTNAEGDRLKEGGKINTSLLTLSRVIATLSQAQQTGKAASNTHVNFRDSKLTQILQPSLAGNCRTVVICCATPSSTFQAETLSTIKFACSAKKIRTQVVVNQVSDVTRSIKSYQDQINSQLAIIAQLRAEVEKLATTTPSSTENTQLTTTTTEELARMTHKHEQELAMAKEQLLASFQTQLQHAIAAKEREYEDKASLVRTRHEFELSRVNDTAAMELSKRSEMLQSELQQIKNDFVSCKSEKDALEIKLRESEDMARAQYSRRVEVLEQLLAKQTEALRDAHQRFEQDSKRSRDQAEKQARELQEKYDENSRAARLQWEAQMAELTDRLAAGEAELKAKLKQGDRAVHDMDSSLQKLREENDKSRLELQRRHDLLQGDLVRERALLNEFKATQEEERVRHKIQLERVENTMATELAEWRNKCAMLEAEATNLSQQVSQYQASELSHRAQVVAIEVQCEEAKQTKEMAQQACRTLDLQVTHLTGELNEATEKVVVLGRDLIRLETTLKTERVAHADAIATVDARSAADRAEMNRAQSVGEQLNKQLKMLQVEMSSKRDELVESKAQGDTLTRQLQRNEVRMQEMQSTIVKLSQDLSEAQTALVGKNATTKQEVDAYRETSRAIEMQLREQLATCESEMVKTEIAKDDAIARLHATEKNVELLKTRVDEVETMLLQERELNHTLSKHQSVAESIEADLKAQVCHLVEREKTLKRDLEQACADMEQAVKLHKANDKSLRDEIVRAQTQAQTALEELAQVQAEFNKNTFQSKATHGEMERRVHETHVALQALEERLTVQQHDLSTANKNVARLENELAESLKEGELRNADLMATRARAEQAESTLQMGLDDIQLKLQASQEMVLKLEVTISTQVEELTTARVEYRKQLDLVSADATMVIATSEAALEASRAEMTMMNENHQRMLAELDTKLQASQTLLTHQEETMERLREELADAESQLEQHQRHSESGKQVWETRMMELQHEKESIQAELKMVSCEANQVREQLEHEVETLKATLKTELLACSADATAAITQAETEVKESNQRIHELEDMLAKVKEEYRQELDCVSIDANRVMQDEMTRTQTAIAEVENLRTMLADSTRRNETIVEQLDSLQANVKTLQARVTDAEAEKESISQLLQTRTQELAVFYQGEYRASLDEVSRDANAVLAQQDELLRFAHEETAEMRTRAEAAEIRLEALQEEIKSNVVMAKEEMTQQLAQVQQMLSENEQHLMNEREHFTSELSQKDVEISKLNERVAKLEKAKLTEKDYRRIKEIKDSREELKQKLEAMGPAPPNSIVEYERRVTNAETERAAAVQELKESSRKFKARFEELETKKLGEMRLLEQENLNLMLELRRLRGVTTGGGGGGREEPSLPEVRDQHHRIQAIQQQQSRQSNGGKLVEEPSSHVTTHTVGREAVEDDEDDDDENKPVNCKQQ